MEQGAGRFIHFKNTLILLTPNVGTDLIAGRCKDPAWMPDPEAGKLVKNDGANWLTGAWSFLYALEAKPRRTQDLTHVSRIPFNER